ncbi:MAG: galactose-1-phosphate uridylyltransferase, partial [Vulcanimicrobiota bacterium]
FVIATERSKRPEDFTGEKRQRNENAYDKNCPFCKGNEKMTSDATLEIDGGNGWEVRSVFNKFSAFHPKGDRERHARGIYRNMNGVGQCEVIIESPLHNDNFCRMSIPHIKKVIDAYVKRFNWLMEQEYVEAVIVFKNYGSSAGSSLAHPHSQIIATPVVPTTMRNQLEAAKRHYDDTGRCPHCQMLEEEMREKERLVTQKDSFVVFCPYASGTPFETWIVPRNHKPNFGDIDETEKEDLARIFQDIFCRYHIGLNDPDYNLVIKTPPRDESNDRSYHWFVKILPKITKLAGFELGSGMLINVTLPEDNAEFLRNVKINEK